MTADAERSLSGLRYVASPAIAPGGKQVAFLSITADLGLDRWRSRLLVISGSDAVPRAVDTDDAGSPCWSPAGHLAYVARDDTHRQHVRIHRDRALPRLEWTLPDGVTVSDLAWHDGGRQLLVLTADRSHRAAVFIVDPPAWRVVPSPIILPADVGSIQPDSNARGFTYRSASGRDPGDHRQSVFRATAAGSWSRLTPPSLDVLGHAHGLANQIAALVRPTPIGSTPPFIAVVSTGRQAGVRLRTVTPGFDRSIGTTVRTDVPIPHRNPGIAVTHDRRFMSTFADKGAAPLAVVHDSGEVRRISEARSMVTSFDRDPISGRIATIEARPDAPGILAIRDYAGRPIFESVASPASTGVVRTLQADGHGCWAWEIVPRDGQVSTAVCYLHGGPHAMLGSAYIYFLHRLAAAGMAVLIPEPAGSEGFGRAHLGAIDGAWGQRDRQDVLACLRVWKRAATSPLVLIGESYGAYLASSIAATGPPMHGLIMINGVYELPSLFVDEGEGHLAWSAALGGAPWRPTNALMARSPISWAGRIRTPTLLIHAQDDTAVPPSQSASMRTAIRESGGDVELVEIERADHMMLVTGRPSVRVEVVDRMVQWIARVRAGGPS